MTPNRARVSVRLDHFVRVIARSLPQAYGLILQGSWANDEYHAVEERGLIQSYSDVDFVCDIQLRPNDRLSIYRTLYQAAASCDLAFQGISIRRREEMRYMWTLQAPRDQPGNSTSIKCEFILFWTLIGAAEVCAAWSLNQDSLPRKQHYYLNKFFLSMWRDLGIVTGHHLHSYRETISFAARWLPAEICAASYAMKLGAETTIPWYRLQSAHHGSILIRLKELMESTAQYESISHLLNDLALLDPCAVISRGKEMLKDAERLEGNLSARKAARRRLFQKLSVGVP